MTTSRSVSRTVEIAAPPERVWALVSDLPGMGAFSPEAAGGQWVGNASGPAPGAVFVGHNRTGGRSWSTRSTVTRAEPGRVFAFDVRSAGLPVASWSYELEPTDGGCRVTETWSDRRGRLLSTAGSLLTGVRDRAEFTGRSIEQTLAGIKAAAERG